MSEGMIKWGGESIARKEGKTKSARARFEEAKAQGEHAHYYGSQGSECSVNCAGFDARIPVRPVPTVPFR